MKKKQQRKIGSKWRISLYPFKKSTPRDIDSNTHPSIFDELCIDEWFHLEQMDNNYWWLCIGDQHFDIFVDKHTKKLKKLIIRDPNY